MVREAAHDPVIGVRGGCPVLGVMFRDVVSATRFEVVVGEGLRL
jgi:hypothetical protein